MVAALIPACRLWEKTSAAGNRYLIGRMGGVRVMVSRTTVAKAMATTRIRSCSQRPPQYDGARSQVTPAEPSQPNPNPVRRRAQRGGDKQQMDDDPVPF